MDLKTLLTVTTPNEFQYFESLEMEIIPEGLEIRAKSPLFAKWIKETQTQQQLPPIPGMVAPKIGPKEAKFWRPTTQWEWGPYGFAAMDSQYFAEERPNLMWLFNTELDKGCVTHFYRAISINNWEDYFTTCAKSIQNLYLDHMRSACVKLRFSEILESF